MIREAFIITSLAGLSTLLGSIIIFFKNPDKVINKALGFAIGVMASISILELLKEGYTNLIIENNIIKTILYIIVFFTSSFILTSVIEGNIKEQDNYSNPEIYRVGIISMIAIVLHNIPEGIVTFLTSSVDIKIGIKLAIAIAMHNIPEGIAIALPLFYSTKKRLKPILYTLLSGLSEVVGGLMGYVFLYKIITPTIMGNIYIMISGIMIYISIFSMLPIIRKENKLINYIFIVIGVLFMIITSKII